MNFEDLDFSATLLEALDMMGFKKPTPIQEQAIPIIKSGRDIIACAQTGTGKTAAFLLPILDKLAQKKTKGDSINTLIIAPTRELALQIDQQIEGFGYFVGASSLPVYGGGDASSWDQQKQALSKGADIIVATPGRLISHINLGYVNLDKCEHLILDEADRMLDMGFYDDIVKIVGKLPKVRQNLLFSATMPPKIRGLAKTILKDPAEIALALSKPAAGVLQGAYLAYNTQKIALIEYLLNGKESYPSIIIFASTKRTVKDIAVSLRKKGFQAQEISSDLQQKEREQALLKFKSKRTQILVATDILARGIDIKEISLVINYSVPQDAEDYVHRVGRTARADKTGVALTIISDQDQQKFASIERLIEMEIQKIPLPKELGEGPKYEPNKRPPNSGGRRFGGNRGGGGGGRGRGPRGGGGNRNGGNRSGGKRSGKNHSSDNRNKR